MANQLSKTALATAFEMWIVRAVAAGLHADSGGGTMANERRTDRDFEELPFDPKTLTGTLEKGLLGLISADLATANPFAVSGDAKPVRPITSSSAGKTKQQSE
jgi:hypothetical protein